MGVKGDKNTADGQLAAELLVSRLEAIAGISSKKMFGGHGVFHRGKMFGIVDSKGQAYFKVGEANRHEYEEKGSHKHGKMPYYSIPGSILNDGESLLVWAKKSIEISKS